MKIKNKSNAYSSAVGICVENMLVVVGVSQKVKFLGLILYTIRYAVIPKVRGIPKINFRIK